MHQKLHEEADATLYPDLARPVAAFPSPLSAAPDVSLDAGLAAAVPATGRAPDVQSTDEPAGESIGAPVGVSAAGAAAVADVSLKPEGDVIGVVFCGAPDLSSLSALADALSDAADDPDADAETARSLEVVCVLGPDDENPFTSDVADVDGAGIDGVRAEDVHIVELAGEATTLGRARNAGYRRLKKTAPDIGFVQFVETGAHLDPDWLAVARRFMRRRPEVAVIEGSTGEQSAESRLFARLREAARARPAGEVLTAGPGIFVRASAFEAAGGFRGDLAVGASVDLCIRLRRRGLHIWRLEEPMAVRAPGVRSMGDWFAAAGRDGRAWAAGAALHGAAPERYGVAERGRAVLWGGLFPLFFALLAVGAAGGVYAMGYAVLAPFAAGAVVATGLAFYLLRVIFVALRRGPFSPLNWAYAFFSTLGQFAACGGVMAASANGNTAPGRRRGGGKRAAQK